MPRGFLQKDENQGWELFEDLAEKTIQWESAPEKPRNSNPISSKGSFHSIESSIAAEAKIVSPMRRLEALKKETTPVNQISPTQVTNPGCTYCQAPMLAQRPFTLVLMMNNL